MKRCIILAFTALLLLILAACEADMQPSPDFTLAGTVESTPPTPTVPEEDEKEHDVQEEIEEETANSHQTFTIKQIQAALERGPFIVVGWWGEETPQVISVQRVERTRDYIFLEPAQEYVDLTNAFLYRIEFRFRQSIEDFTWHSELFPYSDFFRRDGDYTILTDHFYFIDINGEPESAFVSC